jgi:hypothetical protein
MTNTMTNRTPATIRIIVVLSITLSLSLNSVLRALPNLNGTGKTPGARKRRGSRPAKRRSLPAAPVKPYGTAGTLAAPALFDPCAATLNQDDQYDDKQDTGNNADNCGTVHGFYLLPSMVV